MRTVLVNAKSWLYRNALSATLAAIFLGLLIGQLLTGWRVWNSTLEQSGAASISLLAYLRSGHAISATFENWESEFLQMAMYVLLTVWLRQEGSAESRPLEPAEEEEDLAAGPAPRALSKGPFVQWLYAHSLSLAFLALFALTLAMHAMGSLRHENAERALRGLPPLEASVHLTSARFWFESLQNWQSEFLAVFSLVVLSIWLREKHSPESKPLRAPHSQTGK